MRLKSLISITNLSNILNNLNNIDAKNAKTIIKLLSIDVLKSLDNNKYQILLNNKILTAHSQRQLMEGERYFARFEENKNAQVVLSKLIKTPKLLKNLTLLNDTKLIYEQKDLLKLLSSKESVTKFKDNILQEMLKTNHKETFNTLTHLLFSLNQNVFTIPMFFYDYLGFLQIKKRYNKKTKKSYLNFYAVFANLGAISGLVSASMEGIKIDINVAFEEVKDFLETQKENISYNINIRVLEDITPLYDITPNNQILDIKT